MEALAAGAGSDRAQGTQCPSSLTEGHYGSSSIQGPKNRSSYNAAGELGVSWGGDSGCGSFRPLFGIFDMGPDVLNQTRCGSQANVPPLLTSPIWRWIMAQLMGISAPLWPIYATLEVRFLQLLSKQLERRETRGSE